MSNFLHALILVKSFLVTLFSVTSKISSRLLTAVSPREYVFFTGYTTPFLSHMVQKNGPGTPNVNWTYDLDTNILRKGSDTGALQNIPWLSASISFNKMNLYSLDDFIDRVKFINSKNEPPPPAILVGAWTLLTGNVLNNDLNLQLNVINDEGEELTFSPWDFSTSSPPAVTYDNLYIESGPFDRRVSALEFVDEDLPPLIEAT